MVDIQVASRPGDPGRPNEDALVALPDLLAVLDGVTVPDGLDTGCVHGTAWYARRLAANLEAYHAVSASLPEIVAAAIESVRDEHGATCDLDHPGTPQSTVAALRLGPDGGEYFVLSDSTVVLDRGGSIEAITDRRLLDVAAGTRRPVDVKALTLAKRDHVNRPGGYWIAAADPTAAHYAVTGTVPLRGPDRLRRAALLTDGAACVVDDYHLLDWRATLDAIAVSGPDHVIDLARAFEQADPEGHVRHRWKRHDDATIVFGVLPDARG